MKNLSQLPLELERRAAIQDVISYNKLAREFGLGQVTPENYRSHPFHDVFGMMDDEDLSKGLPLRTALILARSSTDLVTVYSSLSLREEE